MPRILIVAYRPKSGKSDDVLALLAQQLKAIRNVGTRTTRDPWLMHASNGEILQISEYSSERDVERCWEDVTYQDIGAQLTALCDMVPIRSLQESSAAYMDLQAVAKPETPVMPPPS